jgi:hypothetical protein
VTNPCYFKPFHGLFHHYSYFLVFLVFYSHFLQFLHAISNFYSFSLFYTLAKNGFCLSYNRCTRNPHCIQDKLLNISLPTCLQVL